MIVQRAKEFSAWFRSFSDRRTKARIAQKLDRIELEGFFGVTRSVGGAIREMKLDFGPGYRIYYTQRGSVTVFLLLGGDKRTQERDIARAHDILRRIEEVGENDAFDD